MNTKFGKPSQVKLTKATFRIAEVLMGECLFNSIVLTKRKI